MTPLERYRAALAEAGYDPANAIDDGFGGILVDWLAVPAEARWLAGQVSGTAAMWLHGKPRCWPCYRDGIERGLCDHDAFTSERPSLRGRV